MTPPAPRVVLDTNVLLSALVFARGPIAGLRSAWQAGAFVPLASTATTQELIRVLAYPKFRLGQAQRQELLADYLPWAEAVTVPQPPPAVPNCRDPLDSPFLHLAVAGQAQWLVTGDADLLALAGALPGLAIVTPAAFLQTLPA
ncbi:putative toxin-antitoxin system toxin component, PIN family [Ottowia testudinis]|uniref:Toxin-antitoxin system toxin component, PIN family n=1 Tax=Ottowia testudinis TaxID=2816950 RepID=A0A975CJV8_9BURK|nr:putative toxin-antitoxin system toxin component, PIN family [Ottowia testudinis]QTD45524.1 putative toxin-antitoxin system toxin component, PIN family [Ottowia testudinis]